MVTSLKHSVAARILYGALLLLCAAGPTLAETAPHAMVAAEHPLAAQAGVRILKLGGNAVDAAAAAALAVGVVNPSSCGIGGGGMMLIYLAATKRIYALDYRERAPLAVTEATYMHEGKPDEPLLRNGSLAVAVPGELAGLAAVLRRFGTMSFSQVAQPAIELARGGFLCGDHLARELARTAPKLAQDPGLRATFLNPDGSPRKVGDRISNPQLAATLTRMGDHPDQTFYHGTVGSELVDWLHHHGGVLTTNDLARYRPKWRTPISYPYQSYEVFGMPPPSSGGGIILETLAILSGGAIGGLELNSPPYLEALIESFEQSFGDRVIYYGDPDFVSVPMGFLLSPAHIDELRRRAFSRPLKPPSAPAPHDHGTSALCVVDSAGNVVSLTTTINTSFGAKEMVPSLGIILNDEMDDFELAPGIPNAYGLTGKQANAVAPGKRPLSSMAPTIVMRNRRPALVLGGSGGPTIITAAVQVMLNVLDFKLDPGHALAAPRIHEQAVPDVVLVEQAMSEATRAALAAAGYKLRVVPMLGDVEAIAIVPDGLDGASDPRKGGQAVGY